MRRLLVAVLAVPLIVAAAPRPRGGEIALGIGAASSNEVVVKIAGKNVTVKLAGVNNGTYAGQAFLQCLVASRIVHVDRTAGRVTMLDGTSVADHVAEFLQTRTTSDPCALGKAAYVPQTPALAGSVQVNPPPGEAESKTPAKREGHVSFGSGSALSGSSNLGASPAPQRQSAPAAAAPKPSDQPTIYRPPTMGTSTPPTTSTYTPPTSSTTTVGSQGTSTPPTTTTYTPPTAGTTTIPTTTSPPPL